MLKEKAAKAPKMLCVDNLRHAEYYGMQKAYDDLYAKSQAGETFTNLMEMILARENILLAYRNIKTNDGSDTAGTDRLTIKDIGKLSPDNFCQGGFSKSLYSKAVVKGKRKTRICWYILLYTTIKPQN